MQVYQLQQLGNQIKQNRKVAEEESKWEDEFSELDDYEPTDEELMETENIKFNNINLELE